MSSLRSLLLASILTLALAPPSAGALPIEWRRAADDLEAASWRPSGFLTAEVLLFRSSLTRYQLGVVRAAEFGARRSSVRRLAQASGALFGINANFFDETGRALGLVVSRGSVHQRLHRGGNTLTGVFSLGQGGAKIVHRSAFSPHLITEAVQAGPRLVVAGRPAPDLRDSSSSRRSGLCVDRTGRVTFFVATSGLFSGMTIKDLQQILVDPAIGCLDALNLDGGGSTQLYISRNLPGASPGIDELYIPGSDDVPVMLALFTRRDTESQP